MLDSVQAETPVLAAERVSKSFGAIPVLFSVSFDLRAGEVHALIGENGAGKSTLMKVLSGFHPATSGTLRVDGEEVTLPPNGQAEDMGIVLIHQELNLAEQMTVEENIFLGREQSRNGFLDRAAMTEAVRKMFLDVGLDISPKARISSLSIAEKQMVEIVKAMSRNARVLIMDEPTAVLTEAETTVFFAQVEKLKAKGTAIMFVSHKLQEVQAIADRVTILRDGQWIATKPTGEFTLDAMAQMMVGRELSDLYPPMNEADVDAERVLEIEGLTTQNIRNVSFDLRKGEVLGFSGLIGSGRTEVFEAICGLKDIDSGVIRVHGEEVRFASVADARDAGICYLTKDRKEKGLLLEQEMRPNMTLLALPRFVKGFMIDRDAEQEALARGIRRFDIRARDPKVKAGDLSGGNQQKLLLAKIMEADPKIVIIDEPTRGIDVGTKQQIYHFIAALAAEGMSVVVISSEMPEIIGVCHRVFVMRDGQIMGALTGDAINETEIVRYAAGLKGEKHHG
ncbi:MULTISPECIES: sugar ABC transporter ATP-binding protein [Halocynthiibacter]|uniref:Autoinducer 2 import ATP-binding protein LsrA n=1 Tax=Halocynthiibacter halioticoli TaxID=2986804 RepID=A0AAE3IZC2_9RHOB|nr:MULTISPECIES: sugar ABC transporter ATP-binding protein [Halocynthiibacter]MCV6823895.1 sugar ABC transporter ATP-binding protein [Halocynthiibacter halioticoli]MCW4056896.1 sugar ABC transporter ATP-binding protein [Halocynthiibacter sp. SDUM655004]